MKLEAVFVVPKWTVREILLVLSVALLIVIGGSYHNRRKRSLGVDTAPGGSSEVSTPYHNTPPPASMLSGSFDTSIPGEPNINRTLPLCPSRGCNSNHTSLNLPRRAVCDAESLGHWERRGSEMNTLVVQLKKGKRTTLRPEYHWVVSPEVQSRENCRFDYFSRARATRCLQGRKIVFVGNSNIRGLYTALRALVTGTPQLTRQEAKKLCALDPANCITQISLNDVNGSITSSNDDAQPLTLRYLFFTGGIFTSELYRLINETMRREVDMVVTNSVLNLFTAHKDTARVFKVAMSATPKLNSFASLFPRTLRHDNVSSEAHFYWDSTSPKCQKPISSEFPPNLKKWHHRSQKQMNLGIREVNKIVREGLDSRFISVLRGDKMLQGIFNCSIDLAPPPPPSSQPNSRTKDASARRGEAESRRENDSGETTLETRIPPLSVSNVSRLCGDDASSTENFEMCSALYDDPIHHQMVDRAKIQILLNRYCPNPR